MQNLNFSPRTAHKNNRARNRGRVIQYVSMFRILPSGKPQYYTRLIRHDAAIAYKPNKTE